MQNGIFFPHKGKAVSAVTFLIAASVMAGCTADKADVTELADPVELTLSWWGNDARHEYTIEAVDEFEDLYPGISVTCNYTEWSGYQTRSNVQMISGTEADVMQINYAWIEQFSPDGNGYYDLNTLGDTLDLSAFGEYELGFGMQNGKLNAIPIAMNVQTPYINKTVYDKYGLDIPSTWEDYFTAAKAMNGEVYPLSMAAKPAFFFIVAYAEQQCGKSFMEHDGSLNFTADDFKIMLDFYCRLINEKVMPQVEYFDRTQLDAGKYAGLIAWLSDANYCDKAIAGGSEFVIADYPAKQESESGEGWYAKPATMYAISKNTAHPQEAAMLLDFLLNSEEMAGLQGVEKGIPLSTKARDHLSENDMLGGMQYSAFEKMEEYDDLPVLSPYFENDDLIDEFRNSCNVALYERGDIDEEAQKLFELFSKVSGNGGDDSADEKDESSRES